jgi:polar amino acid transport system permease protein/octopine/nopaline transport system permease protein
MLDLRISIESLPKLAKGASLTLELAVLVLVTAAILAIPVAFALNARRAWISKAAGAYVMLFRGTPALIQIFLVYYGTSQFAGFRDSIFWPIFREPYWCAVIALGLNGAAYTGNILAGAIRAVPQGTIEAGRAVGLSWFKLQRLVVVPQAVRIGFPAYTNEVIQTVKATSLASTITLIELTGSAQMLVSDTYAPYEVFLSAALMYLAITFALTVVFGKFEDRLYRAGRDPAAQNLKTAVEA